MIIIITQPFTTIVLILLLFDQILNREKKRKRIVSFFWVYVACRKLLNRSNMHNNHELNYFFVNNILLFKILFTIYFNNSPFVRLTKETENLRRSIFFKRPTSLIKCNVFSKTKPIPVRLV